MMETVITALTDEFELNKKYKHGKLILTACLCIFMFLVGLPQCTRVSNSAFFLQIHSVSDNVT